MKKTDSQLPAVLATHQPKPTAAQVRRATAQALADDYAAETKRLREKYDALKSKLRAAATKHLQRHLKTLEPGYEIFTFSGYSISLRFNFAERDASLPEPLAALLKECSAHEKLVDHRKRKTAKDFEAELFAAAASQSQPLETALLADPVIKQALLEAGKKALSLPTATDKAAAIAV